MTDLSMTKLGVWTIFAVLFSLHSSAATLIPINGNGGIMVASGTTTFSYYGVTGFNLTADPINSNFQVMNIGAGGDLFFFDISSTVAKGQTGKSLLLTITQSGVSGAPVGTVPIITYGTGNALCSEAQCQDQKGTFNQWFAVRYTEGTTLRIGLRPADICANNTSFQGCTGAVVTAPVPYTSGAAQGSTTSMPLTFSFAIGETTGPPTAAALDTASVTLVFQADGPTLTCPAVHDDLYFPGDGQIFLNTAAFSMGTANAPGLASSRAPANALIVVGSLGGTPTTALGGFTSNPIVQRVAIGDVNQAVSGFTNTTTGSDNLHNLNFLVRDAAGLIAAGDANCALPNVQTSSIQGFLSRNRCFIATAAFRSGDAEPVRLLQAFRDQVLMKSGIGRSFVDLYYTWSPPFAEWLIEHPVFRFPVLLVLAPVEIAVWFVLNPVFLGLSWLLAIFFAIALRREQAC
ncbi:MAG: hypothetical protein A2428_02790 [Bdellovibrionales bacterium RIFOXYC1_FULL_54_43]|nr:MAG: hypothetical protein A2428_02790 [Bdellovibrionales bacterium RIFOXYC1_FULL_54_43]OFZ80671.1 MAG: hypothetical protein A2603_05810 [Bdellovibrionales bacterium RIFOXYD1_FULL_55_31]